MRRRSPQLPVGWQRLLGLGVLVATAMLSAHPEFRRPDPQARPISPQQPSQELSQQRLASLGSVPVDAQRVLDQLAMADQKWVPRSERLADGTTRYTYKRQAGDPPLSIAEIKALIRNPPSFMKERQAIVQLWKVLLDSGVKIRLEQPRRQGAAGEWDPKAKTLRVKPQVLAKGSLEFARVLNHEAIHVAQSCHRGSLDAKPEPLGISTSLPAKISTVLDAPLYKNVSAKQRHLELEAYANQYQLGLGSTLIETLCL